MSIDTFAGAPHDTRSPQYQTLKGRIHQELLNRLNLDRLTRVSRVEAEPELRSVIGTLLEKEAESTPLSLYERESIVTDVLNELFGGANIDCSAVSVSCGIAKGFGTIWIAQS